MINWLNETGSQWLIPFSAYIIQNTIFLVIILLILYRLKKWEARYLFSIGFLSLFKWLVPPFLSAPIQSSEFDAISPIDLPIEPVSSVSTQTMESVTSLSGSGLLFTLWIGGVLFFLIQPIWASMRLRRRIERSNPIRLADQDCMLQKPIPVFRTNTIAVPLTMGVIRPKIYVPDAWSHWPGECRQMVLSHEMAHIQRRDGLTVWIQRLVQAIAFFNPLVWCFGNRLNMWREMACDDLTMATESSRCLKYPRYLVQIAEEVVQTEGIGISASALIRQKHELLKRISYLMQEGRMKKIPIKILTAVIVVALIAMIPLSWHCSNGKPTEDTAVDNNSPLAAEVEKSAEDEEVPVFVNHDEPPEPIGGYAAVQANVHYPKIARLAGIEGRVMVWAKIEEDGNVYKTRIMTSLGNNGCDEAAVYAIQNVEWKPAIYDDKPIAVWVAVPVDFKLSDDVNKPRKYDIRPKPVGGFASLRKVLVYPEEARKAGIEGIVTVTVIISKTGEVLAAEIINSFGNKACDEAALVAIREVEWSPAIKDNKPIDLWTTVTVKFLLEDLDVKEKNAGENR